jgi:nucleotide-binding universal stress UspA family protein
MPASHTILVGVTNSPASLEAVTVACQVAKARRSQVHVVHVIEVRRGLAVNADLDTDARHGEQILRRAEEAASHHGITVNAELLQARQAGEALVEEARNRKANALVVGLSRSDILGHYRMGKTAAYVLQHADTDVWIIRKGPANAEAPGEAPRQ